MGALSVVWSILSTLLLIYFFVMWARFVLDLVRTFNRHWRPTGFWLVVVELVYTVTDPPVRFFRRLVPPIRIGQIALDLGWSLAMLVVIVLMTIVSGLSAATAVAAA
ncbi:YggT family protein [Agromyces silvae]|uniref:YggT family protein n=1 Tax=Agromyces silvae TaxID=3388266 RepID=UPI00280B24D9|nr:YggT family protein [Agromyces protaetiae]